MALDGVGGQGQAPVILPQGKRPGTHCTGDWAGPRVGLDERGKSRLHRDSIRRASSRSQAVIPTVTIQDNTSGQHSLFHQDGLSEVFKTKVCLSKEIIPK
jgi:hypothetical protein